MDSVTQFALGGAIGGAILGPKMGRRAVVWGGACATLPDLDMFVLLGDPVSNFTYHRGVSHAVFFLTLAAPPLTWLIQRVHPEARSYSRRCLLAVWLCLVTHPLLDCFTVYGTQVLLPFSNYPVGWSTIFIIDPLYTAPLLVGIVLSWRRFRDAPRRAARVCVIGLLLSSCYLAATVGIKAHVDAITRTSLAGHGIDGAAFLTTPAPFNVLLWRIVVMQPDHYLEGFYSLLDGADPVAFASYPTEPALLDPIAEEWVVERLRWFTKGFYRVRERGQGITITDLRMGIEPDYIFSFRVGERRQGRVVAVRPTRAAELNVRTNALAWIWQRIWNGRAPPGTPEARLGGNRSRYTAGGNR